MNNDRMSKARFVQEFVIVQFDKDNKGFDTPSKLIGVAEALWDILTYDGYGDETRDEDGQCMTCGAMDDVHCHPCKSPDFVDDGKHLDMSVKFWEAIISIGQNSRKTLAALASAERRDEHLDNHSTRCKHDGWVSRHPNVNNGERTCDDCGVKMTGGK